MNSHLTIRETQVLRLVSLGYSQKEIAEKLSISSCTVDVHVKNIKDKTGIHKSTELTAFWYINKYHIPVFEIPERMRKLVVGAMLALSVFLAFTHTDALMRLRESNFRMVRTSARRIVRRDTDYYLSIA